MPLRLTPDQAADLLGGLVEKKRGKRAWHRQFQRTPASERTDAATGRVVHSKNELQRLAVLRQAQAAGIIRALKHQVRYPLEHPALGALKITGKAGIARRAFYTADFVYELRNSRGDWVETIEESKGFDDAFSRYRRAVFEWLYGRAIVVTGRQSKTRQPRLKRVAKRS